jgi:ABC-2 type transport system permease protein
VSGRKVLAIGWVNLRRVFRDRIGVFFIVVFPFLIILAIGAVFGSGFTPVVGVVDSEGSGPLGADLVRRLDATEGIEVRSFEDGESLTTAVERGAVEAGLVILGGYDERVREGETVAVPFLARPAGAGAQVGLTVEAVMAEQSAVIRAARFVEVEGLGGFDEGLRRAVALSRTVPRVEVREAVAGGEGAQAGLDYGAAQELVLFVFLTSLSASSMLIESRRLGVSRRMLASPSGAGTILAGETVGRFAIALFQGLLIFVVTLVLFGVDWGDPAAGIATVVLFALVGTGAAMLMGSSLHNAEQAGGLGVFIGLAFAALGGCMVPIDLFPDPMVTIAHLTPHAWALDAFDQILREGGTFADVAPELGVLAVYAGALLVVASLAFRRRLTAPEGTT